MSWRAITIAGYDRQSWFQRSRRRDRVRGLRVEQLEDRRVFAGLPFGAMSLDTAEFMLGTVTVTPVLLESDGTLDPSTEDWTAATIEDVLAKVRAGVQWWEELLAKQNTVHSLQFVIDTTYALNPVPTRYEPINRISNDYTLYTQEFLQKTGFAKTGDLATDMLGFNHAQRQKHGTDWAFTIIVANSTSDVDDQFPAGGHFRRAFAFAGGLFFVTPSGRPASTFAHETGHIFWAHDEYLGGGTFAQRRGYYNAPNSNAADNPAEDFQQQPSIMASGSLLTTAYNDIVNAASTLEIVGWRDSDGNGIFDVLDVPLELDGTGYFDPASGHYRFDGLARVGRLPNLNSSGLRNDITINRVSQVQYRIDGGAWITLAQPNQYEVQLNLTIPLSGPEQLVEIRALDGQTQVSSNIFQGRVARADAVKRAGINGFVWIDANRNGLRDAGEYGDAGWRIDVLTPAGQPLNLRKIVEPDSLPDGVIGAGTIPGISIRAIGSDADGRVAVFSDSVASTGTKTFRGYSRSAQSWMSTWSGNARRMQVDFATPTSVVDIDVIGAGLQSYGRMEAFDAQGRLLHRVTSRLLASNQVERIRVESSLGDIAYVVIGGHANTSVRLDNLRYGAETSTTTRDLGQFSVSNLPTGTYMVTVSPASSSHIPVQSSGYQQIVQVVAGQAVGDVDFAYRVATSDWQNPNNRFDVNNDTFVTALDALIVINDLNQFGARDLAAVGYVPPPFLDVSGDGFLSALDALLLINALNRGGAGEASGEASGGFASVASDGDSDKNSRLDPAGEQSSGEGPTAAHDQAVWELVGDSAPAPAEGAQDRLGAAGFGAMAVGRPRRGFGTWDVGSEGGYCGPWAG
jgi:hypothetical protein